MHLLLKIEFAKHLRMCRLVFIISPFLHLCTQEFLISDKSFLHEIYSSSQAVYAVCFHASFTFVTNLVTISVFLKKTDLQLVQFVLV